MLRRLTIVWLVVSILGYGMALAADMHAGLAMDHVHATADHVGPDADGAGDAGGCDHCCHGTFHLLGLRRCDTSDPSVERGVFPLSPAVSSASFSLPSPLRPPISV